MDPTPGKVSTQFRSLFRSLVLDPELVRGEFSDRIDRGGRRSGGWQDL